MSDYQSLISLIEDERVKFGINLPKELHKTLVLGQTRWVCRHGTLSDGHEKLTSSQRYYQAIKEIYYLANNIQMQKVQAMRAQAALIEAETAMKKAATERDKLLTEADYLEAKTRLTSALVTVQDQLRMLDEYNQIRIELKDEVEAKYPHGIEQAEKDNWEAVAKYRLLKEKTPGLARERLDNIPLDPVTKAEIGNTYNRLDATAPLMIQDSAKASRLALEMANGWPNKVYKLEKTEQ